MLRFSVEANVERIVIAVIILVIYLIYRVIRGSDPSPTETSHSTNRASFAPLVTSQTGKSYPFSEILPDPNLPQVRSIHSKIRGVTKRNDDGSDRQQIIRLLCQSGDALCFIREPENPFDRNAVRIHRIVCSEPDKPRVGQQLGYLSRDLAEEFAPRMDHDGFVLMAEVLDVSGGHYGESLGVNFRMSVYMPMPKEPPESKPRKRKSRQKKQADDPVPAAAVESPQ